MKGADPLPNEVKVEIRGTIKEHFQGIREEVPVILTSLAQATVQVTIPKAPGRLGYTLIAEPSRPIGPDAWESGIISGDAEKFRWHEFGTGEHKEKGARGKYPIVPTGRFVTSKQRIPYLKFKKEGHYIMKTSRSRKPIMHPGVPARGMLRQAIREVLPSYMEMFRRLGIRVLPTWGRG